MKIKVKGSSWVRWKRDKAILGDRSPTKQPPIITLLVHLSTANGKRNVVLQILDFRLSVLTCRSPLEPSRVSRLTRLWRKKTNFRKGPTRARIHSSNQITELTI